MENINQQVVNYFGKEWIQYDQWTLSLDELKKDFNWYFSIFSFEQINKNSVGFDMGCGSGLWAELMASKCGLLNCIAPSTEALKIAKNNLSVDTTKKMGWKKSVLQE